MPLFIKFIFYRAYITQLRREGKYNDPQFTAVILVSLFLVHTILLFMSLIVLLTKHSFSVFINITNIIILSLLILGINSFLFLFKSRYKKIVKELSNYPHVRRMRIIMWSTIIGIVLATMGTAYIDGTIRRASINEGSINTYGTITSTYKEIGGKYRLHYEFKINGKIYKGSEEYSPQAQHREINEGDECEVVYARSNPNINNILKTKYGVIRIIYKIRGNAPLDLKRMDTMKVGKLPI